MVEKLKMMGFVINTQNPSLFYNKTIK